MTSLLHFFDKDNDGIIDTNNLGCFQVNLGPGDLQGLLDLLGLLDHKVLKEFKVIQDLKELQSLLVLLSRKSSNS
jgi:hypothetical protein